MRVSARFRALALAALVGASSFAVPARAQDAAAQSAPAAAAQAPAAVPGQEASTGTQALRRTADAPPPRTLRAYWHVFIAFTLAWLLVFGYAISLGRRFRRLEEQLDRLETA